MERERGADVPTIASSPKRLQQPGLGRAKDRSHKYNWTTLKKSCSIEKSALCFCT